MPSEAREALRTVPSNWAGFQGFTVIAGLFSHLYQSFPCWSPVPGMLWGKATATAKSLQLCPTLCNALSQTEKQVSAWLPMHCGSPTSCYTQTCEHTHMRAEHLKSCDEVRELHLLPWLPASSLNRLSPGHQQLRWSQPPWAAFPQHPQFSSHPPGWIFPVALSGSSHV